MYCCACMSCALGDKIHEIVSAGCCEGHLETGNKMIQTGSGEKSVCVCGCLSAYLAVEVRGVYTGFDDVE